MTLPYYYHGTTLEALIQILKAKKIKPSAKTKKARIRESPWIFANIFPCYCPKRLTKLDRTGALGEISIIIDPLIAKYHLVYFNPGWHGELTDSSIRITEKTMCEIQTYLCNKKGHYFNTHEALIKGDVSIKYVIGLVVFDDDLRQKVKQLTDIRTFKYLPKLL